MISINKYELIKILYAVHFKYHILKKVTRTKMDIFHFQKSACFDFDLHFWMMQYDNFLYNVSVNLGLVSFFFPNRIFSLYLSKYDNSVNSLPFFELHNTIIKFYFHKIIINLIINFIFLK